ncbi:malonyl-CoA decarboxylase [Tateyamaria omphalii]|uniref:malonyl-CoA decarboxylase n=1 Tax=Tateyamaria omphalii TaxID=299262 RepID=UPI001C99B2E6|nr:malonyl-CoA decarboxylase [Tateyamaria omphalii]MBY5935130.1 malonyl-CoA decarboxylase [Tateyamaria omphalii]
MTMLADLLSTVFERPIRIPGRATADARSTPDLVEALAGTDGERSGQILGRLILDRFEHMDDDARLEFFTYLATEMDFDPGAVRAALDAYEQDPGRITYQRFAEAAEPRRQEFVRRLNRVPQATGELVAMRAHLLKHTRSNGALAALDLDFQHLFSSWFNRGFLVLRPINWESPAHILDKIIAYEAVHAIDSWDDLRRRLAPEDRRCFAFFHPAMADEPLIFVEVALTKGIPDSVQGLLSEDRQGIFAEDADTAVFYSISNCQAGLANISFGNSLIKQVAVDISLQLPGLKTFVTLSPIPGLNTWLAECGIDADPSDTDRIRNLAAHYLLESKRADGAPRDPVARFHLGNGAQVHKVHADADVSDNGLAQSSGVMVNYLYDLKKVSQNHERFATEGKIAASSEMRSMSSGGKKLLVEEKGQ